MATNVTSKGQVTVPKSVSDYLGLKPGVAVTFERLLTGEVVLRAAKRGVKPRPSKFVPPDFYIGAHAAVSGHSILTRDRARYQSYFPTVALIAPAGD